MMLFFFLLMSSCCAQIRAVSLIRSSLCFALTNNCDNNHYYIPLCLYFDLRFNSHSFACRGMSVLLLHVRNEGERELGHMGSRVAEEEN